MAVVQYKWDHYANWHCHTPGKRNTIDNLEKWPHPQADMDDPDAKPLSEQYNKIQAEPPLRLRQMVSFRSREKTGRTTRPGLVPPQSASLLISGPWRPLLLSPLSSGSDGEEDIDLCGSP